MIDTSSLLKTLCLGTLLSLGAAPALALDANDYQLRGGIGVIGIEAKEYVYNGSGSPDVLSLLIWQSAAPVLTAGFQVTLPDGWTFDADVQVALAGDSYMEDYDWLAPFRPSFAFNDWTHRSQHPNTNLDWFFDGRLAIGKDMQLNPDALVNLHGGFKYTDLQWTATGGSFVYSVGGFRDSSGNFAAGVDGIIYRQKLPALFAGANAEMTYGRWGFDIGGHAGVTFLGEGVDKHLLRTPPLHFVDKLNIAPLAGAEAEVTYDTGGAAIFLKGSMEKVFLARADTQTYNNNTGTLLSSTANGAGGELISGTITTGFKGDF